MKNLLSLAAFLLLLVAVSSCNSLPEPKICAYCGQPIYWSKVSQTWYAEQYQNAYDTVNGKYYHPWCLKAMHLEQRIDSLEKKCNELTRVSLNRFR